MFNQIGIDTIQLIGNHQTVIKLVERMGLSVTTPSKNSPVSRTITKMENSKEYKQRYRADEFKPVTQIVKLSKGKGLSNYMIITKNIPLLFDHAEHHKKAKDTFCMITFAGLHQPNTKLNSEAEKVKNIFLKRKTFKLLDYDIGTDTQEDKQPINYSRKEPFRADLMPYSKCGVISKGSSLYIKVSGDKDGLSRILYYEKYLKEKNYLKREIKENLKHWKRLELTLTFDVTTKKNKGFTQYIKSLKFVNDLCNIEEVIKKANIKQYENDYLLYQLNTIIDKRFLNNRESVKQFNSVQSLERFKSSDFRRYTL